MKRVIVLFAMLMLVSRAAAPAADLAAADKLFASHDIAAAYVAYDEIARNETDRRIADQATVKAALIEWRFRQDADTARRRLTAAVEGAEEPDLILRELATLEIGERRFADARDAANHAMLLAPTADATRQARALYARAAILEAQATGARDSLELRDAHTALKKMVQLEFGLLEPSSLLLHSSLLLDDGQAALAAIRSYYRLVDDAIPFNNISPAVRRLEEILPAWRGPEKTPDQRVPLITALAGACLYPEAAQVARDPRGTMPADPAVEDIVAYARFLEAISVATDEYYRQLTLGTTPPAEWFNVIATEAERLRAASSWGVSLKPVAPGFDGTPSPEIQAIDAELRARFRAHITIGTTAGYLDMHFGHEISAESRQVTANAADGSITLIVLDRMVSNGFQSWAWNYTMQHGGWAKLETIVDVRPAGADGATNSWRTISDPVEREILEQRIARLLKEDAERAAADPCAYLPGLRLQLRLRGAEDLRAELSAAGKRGAELRAAFIASYAQRQQETSIFAHEGRHVIDKRLGITDSTELEFRAKISEVLASPTPHGTFAGAILGPNLGDQTPHGQAQLRIVRALVEWMTAHADQIPGLDRTAPIFPQMMLLNSGQLHEFLRGIDPGPAAH